MADGHLVDHGLLVVGVDQILLRFVVVGTVGDGILRVVDIGVGFPQVFLERGAQCRRFAGYIIQQLHVVVIQFGNLRGVDYLSILRRVGGVAIGLVSHENDDQ